MKNISDQEAKIILRMQNTGDYIVRGVGNFFWANNTHRGCLIEAVTKDELDALWSLEAKEIIKSDTITKRL